MKKTMFITSVIMVVVMAIALTTSSLAWFSADGRESVTTNTFKVTATAGTSDGIAISHDGSTWSITSISLETTGNTGLNPLVPFAKKNAEISASDLLTALVGGKELAYMTAADYAEDSVKSNEDRVFKYEGEQGTYYYLESDVNQNIGTTNKAGTNYGAYMIGNKFDNNRNFTSDLYRSGYYTDTFYITNVATGAGAEAIYLDAAINFTFNDLINDGTPENPIWRTSDPIEYIRERRGSSKYDTDAVLCVAVLAKVSEFDTNMIEYLGAHDEADDGWEIIAYADSKGGTTVTMGKEATDFDLGSPINACTYSLATTGLNKTNSEALRPERAYELSADDLLTANSALSAEYTLKDGDYAGDGVTIAADVKTIKVVAWYDSTLVNNNAADANLNFDLQFSIHHD